MSAGVTDANICGPKKQSTRVIASYEIITLSVCGINAGDAV